MVQKSVPSKVSRNSGNYWISEMPNIQPKEFPEIPGAKLNGKNTIENLGIPREAVLCFENFGRCCSIRYRKLLKFKEDVLGEWKVPNVFGYWTIWRAKKKSYYIWLWRKNSEILACVAGAWTPGLEVLGARKKRRASTSPLACLPRARPFSLAQTTSKPPPKQATQIREILLVNETWQARCLIHNK